MKLYNIEAIKGDKYKLYELYKNDNYPNDTLFMRDFFRTISNINERTVANATEYMQAFYTHYINQGGDARYWISRTIENIVTYPDIILETWLEVEFTKVDVELTPEKVLRQNEDRLRNRGKRSIKSVMEDIAKETPSFKYSYLERIRKEMGFVNI